MKPVLIALSLLLTAGCVNVSAATPAPTAGKSAPANASPTAKTDAPASPTGAKMDAATAEKQLEAIEQQYFQHTFLNEPVDHRLTRVEKFTFGETYTGTTISRLQRLMATLSTSPAQLEDAEDAPHKSGQSRPVAQARAPQRTPQSSPQSSQAQPAADSGESYPHVTFLENELLKQSFDGQPLEDRLARLETKAFGSPSQNPDLSARTDNLERYAESRLHKKPFINREDTSPEDNPNFPVGYSTVPLDYNNAPAPPSKFDLAKEEMHAEESEAAVAKAPPNEHDRLLARVAWCEQHTFGRTFPDMHLLPRLHQLNSHLFPQDKEKDIQLMDRMDLIVKTVVLQQHPPQQATQ
jgi:hypothetical protein